MIKKIKDTYKDIIQIDNNNIGVDEITDGVFDGFLAHEVQQIVPKAVSGVKDQVTDDNKIVPQSMDASKLIPILTSAIQELSKKVNDLQDQIDILKQN